MQRVMTILEKLNEILRPIGLTIGALIIGFLGAYSSLEFFPNANKKRRWLLVFAGGLTASFGGHMIASFTTFDHLIYALTFFSGLLGMVVINVLVDMVRLITKDPKSIIATAKFFFTRGK